MRLTGYGRGWQEPRAETRWGRFKQGLREPANKSDYVLCAAAMVLFVQCVAILAAILS